MSAGPAPIKSRPPRLQPSTSASTPSSSTAVGSPLSDTAEDSVRSPCNDTSGLLSKTYVIPPRPKPGRKPATDTPQTKRKEQNREAQRAFRERRAARVGELEDELTHKTAAWAEREASLEQALQNQQRAFQRDVQALQAQQAELEHLLENERRLRRQAEAEIQALKRDSKRYSASSVTSYQSGGSTPFSKGGTSPTMCEKIAYRSSQPQSRSDAGGPPSSRDAFDPNCGRCSQGGQCACLDQAFARHTNLAPKHDAEPMEIDFTTSVGPNSNPSNPSTVSNSTRTLEARPNQYAPHDATPSNEPCGFCTDSQNCVCKTYHESTRPAQQQHNSFPKLPPIQAPGTCDKCMEDPERQRFCKMLAQAPPPGSSATSARGMNRTLPSIDEKMSMSCDQAYDALSEEPAFRDRRNSLSFISQLRARPAESTKPSNEGLIAGHQSALEVDIASVLAAMRAERKSEEQRRRN